jgi:hypothetical protein
MGKPITIERYASIKGKRTLGALFPTGAKTRLCWTLEPERDKSRENIPGSDTAIPGGEYKYQVIWHQKFVRGLILRLTPIDSAVKRSGLLMHPGNRDDETLGCPMPGLTKNDVGEVFESVAAMRAVIEYVTGEIVTAKQLGVCGILTVSDGEELLKGGA